MVIDILLLHDRKYEEEKGRKEPYYDTFYKKNGASSIQNELNTCSSLFSVLLHEYGTPKNQIVYLSEGRVGTYIGLYFQHVFPQFIFALNI